VLVGSEVVYLAGRGVLPATMTPYDVCAVRLADGIVLAGDPTADAQRYLDALKGDGRQGAAALTAGGIATAPALADLVERLAGSPWSDAESLARAAGALVGAYPTDG
jgi:hypothetical protein